MERITRKNLDERVSNLNRRMAGRRYYYDIQGRNGYIGLDRFSKNGVMVSTVMVGTKREVGDFLHAMMVAIDDYTSVQA